MAEQSAQEKTEQPTQRRLDRARDEGQVAFSADLGAGLGLLAATLFFWLNGTEFISQLCKYIQTDLNISRLESWDVQETQQMFVKVGAQSFSIVLPLIAITLVVGVLAAVLQFGFTISWAPLKPDLQRIDPKRGLSRLFSSKSLAKGGFAIAKIALISLALWFVLQNEIVDICRSADTHARQLTALGIAIAVKAGFTSAIILVVLGVADVLYQKWQFTKDKRMSRQDLKDEQKEDDGDPLLKARIKRLQREISQRKGLAEVGSATVVIRNPTHYAVALRYEKEADAAPVVVAKGKGSLALNIIKLAEQHAVPIVENRPLAQTLYKTVEIDCEIPLELYAAVVEVLAYIFRLRRAA